MTSWWNSSLRTGDKDTGLAGWLSWRRTSRASARRQRLPGKPQMPEEGCVNWLESQQWTLLLDCEASLDGWKPLLLFFSVLICCNEKEGFVLQDSSVLVDLCTHERVWGRGLLLDLQMLHTLAQSCQGCFSAMSLDRRVGKTTSANLCNSCYLYRH